MKIPLLSLATLIVAIQFYRPHKNVETYTPSSDFLVYENAPPNIVKIFKTSCYDCHSNHTEYKWYDNIAPLSWYVDSNIKRAKFSLNFSEWGDFPSWRRLLFLQGGIPYDIDIEKMPPKNYLLLHKDATLSRKQKETIELWIKQLDFFKE